MDHCLIVAESGLNHGGSVDAAMRLCEAAKEAGADIVKTQTFVPEQSLRADSPDYTKLAALALSFPDTLLVARHCEALGIEFCSTPDDLDSLRFLVEECGVKRIKIGSGSLTYRPLVRSAFATGLPVILSTGMATSYEVQSALADASGPEKVTLLHCVSLYPTPDHLVNLRAMDSLRAFGTKVGYSDHTVGTSATIFAAAMGVDIVEHHLMLDADQSAIDWRVSTTPDQFRWMVRRIRMATLMRGDGVKKPSPEEAAMIPRIRKGDDGKQGCR